MYRHISELKARVTSICCSMLKMDSTKKVTKKLAGEADGTASWVIDMGNDFGLLDQERMQEIWRTQQCLIECIQDPPGVQKVGEVTK
ncbi:unnamed protein product [Leuciscus chuanchicus]